MAIIGVGGEKGGCGKTTLAVNIAVYLAYKGNTVAIIDADKIPHSKAWSVRREDYPDLPQIPCKRATGEIDDTIKAMGKQYDYVVIDCGGLDSMEMRYAMAYGDIFISPFNTSYFDTGTASGINAMAKQASIFNPKLKSYSVLVSCSNNRVNKSKVAAIVGLSEQSNLSLLGSCTHALEVYRHTVMNGQAVMDAKQGKAHADMQNIVEELGL
jgi:chromosome partitioning protein